jgi:hypothetical protein
MTACTSCLWPSPALAACIVAVLAFELENAWTLPASLIVAAICSAVAVRNLFALQRRLDGLR